MIDEGCKEALRDKSKAQLCSGKHTHTHRLAHVHTHTGPVDVDRTSPLPHDQFIVFQFIVLLFPIGSDRKPFITY